eukprot:gene893-2256_t
MESTPGTREVHGSPVDVGHFGSPTPIPSPAAECRGSSKATSFEIAAGATRRACNATSFDIAAGSDATVSGNAVAAPHD